MDYDAECRSIIERTPSEPLPLPFVNSTWKRLLVPFVFDGKTQSNIHPRRAAFMSGGQLKCTWQSFAASFNTLADDIRNNVSLPISEIAHSNEGIRMFVELDYRLRFIPTTEIIEHHARMVQTLVRETFTTADVTCHIARCNPKLKTKKNGDVMIATGVHIVFEHVVTTTLVLRRLALTLDARISHDNQLYTGIVDDAVIHADTASLRLIYAHKMEPCPCSVVVRATKKKKVSIQKKAYSLALSGFTDATYDIDTEECLLYPSSGDDLEYKPIAHHVLSHCSNLCRYGKFVHSSVYIPVYSLFSDGHLSLDITLLSIEEQLRRMCITPIHILSNVHTPFAEVSDLAFITDQYPRGGAKNLFKSDRYKGDLRDIRTATHTPITLLLRKYLPPEYGHLVTSHVTRSRDTLLIHAKGRNSMFCPFKQDIHKSDRLFFMIHMRKHLLSIRCHNTDCLKMLRGCDVVKRKRKISIAADVLAIYRQHRIILSITDVVYTRVLVDMGYMKRDLLPVPPPVEQQPQHTPADRTEASIHMFYKN